LKRQNYISLFSICNVALLLISLCCTNNLFAQTQDTTHPNATGGTDTAKTKPVTAPVQPQKENPKVLTAKILQRDVTLIQSDILSNTLSIINYSDAAVDFTLNVNTPYNWTDISDNSSHHLNPGDSIFIPVRVIPAPDVKGGTEYVINTFLISPQGGQLASDYFFAHTKKFSRWFITVAPQERIYFLNHCDTASFQLNVANAGNHAEDILLTLDNVKKQGLLTDTTGKILHNNYYNFQLNPLEDTTLWFKMKYTGDERNFKTLDLDGYSGLHDMDARTFSVWATGQEAKKTDSVESVQAKNVTFVKLNDATWANPYSGSVFPLTVDMNVYNVLGAQPIMNLTMHGDAFLDNQARLVYSASMYYTTYYLQNNYFNSGSFYAGYFDKNGNDIQIGQIGMPYSYGISLGGWGVEGDYQVNVNNTIGGMVVDGYNNYSVGASAWYRHKFIHVSPLLDKQLFVTSGGIINDRINKIYTYFITESGGLNITNTQHLNFSLTGIDKDYYRNPTPYTFLGGSVSLSYNGSFMNRRFLVSDYFTKASYDTSAYNRNRTSISNSMQYQLNTKWRLQLQNVYYSFPTPVFLKTPFSYSFTNDLYFIRTKSRNTPYIFYNTFTGDNFGLDYFGIGDRYSYFNHENNFMLQAGIQAGYNHLRDYPIPVKDYFTAQPNLLIKYHTISFLSYYSYGPSGIPSPSSFAFAYPQLLLISMHQQYQFINKHFVFDHGFNYTYFNQFQSHSFAYAPEIYYFNNGWRFRVGVNYSFNSTNVGTALVYSGTAIPNENPVNLGPQTSNSVYLNFGIKKDFGIPIPKKWVKHDFKTVLFIAFLDVNGNGKKDIGETVLENVVVSLISNRHRFEALTNEKGEAKMYNLNVGEYYQSIQALQNLKGWFSTSTDSLNVGPRDTVYVPFAKGVKLFGAIIYHPSQYSITPTIDLSHIQITVTDSTGKGYGVLTDSHGEFMVYVPSGNYTLTMNEDWMDGNFKVAQNSIVLNLSHGADNVYQSFYVTEKATKTEVKDFSQPANNTPKPNQPDQVPHH
jgi:hypothetical protein